MNSNASKKWLKPVQKQSLRKPEGPDGGVAASRAKLKGANYTEKFFKVKCLRD